MGVESKAGSGRMVFDRYEIVRRIAIGGMGEIFLARQHGMAGFNRLAVLKQLRPELASEPGFVAQFLDEARLAASLNHPNIVSIYDVGVWREMYFIAMEYIPGESLSRILDRALEMGRRVPLPVALRIAHDVALALDHAHHATNPEGQPLKLVHRDVSPHNIMVREDGVTKVVDFGIAKADNRLARTLTGQVKGKISYMSPEQVDSSVVDGRSDQFSLGVVLWELCTMEKLFEADTPMDMLNWITQEPIERPSEIVEGIPPELDAVIMRMLERSPEARFGRCLEVAQALERLSDALSLDARPSRVAEFVVETVGDRIRERVKDLTPKVASLMSPKPQGATVPWVGKRKRTVLPWAIGGALAVAAVVATLAALFWPQRQAVTSALAAGESEPPAAPATTAPVVAVPLTPDPEVEASDTKPSPAKARAPASTFGYLTVNTEPWTQVMVDGRVLGTTPLFQILLPGGPHDVVLVNPTAGIELRRQVRIRAGELTKLDCALLDGDATDQATRCQVTFAKVR